MEIRTLTFASVYTSNCQERIDIQVWNISYKCWGESSGDRRPGPSVVEKIVFIEIGILTHDWSGFPFRQSVGTHLWRVLDQPLTCIRYNPLEKSYIRSLTLVKYCDMIVEIDKNLTSYFSCQVLTRFYSMWYLVLLKGYNT